MSPATSRKITNVIKRRHKGDTSQVQFVLSKSPRVLVEAPAGYGKTHAMVSKIAYMLATKQVVNPKKLLVLTFSVNAAYKIKKDVSAQLPSLLKELGTSRNLLNGIFVSNYHGFCRAILQKYGRVFHQSLGALNGLASIDDNDLQTIQNSIPAIPVPAAVTLVDFNSALKNRDYRFLQANLNQYNKVVIDYLIPNNTIPYNAIITLTLQLLRDNAEALKFYQSYYGSVLIDEFQDTNTLSLWLISQLIGEKTRIVFMGDSLQRIYGFIGAIPNLLDHAEKRFKLKRIKFNKNYRFASNPRMLKLDAILRDNAQSLAKKSIAASVQIDLQVEATQSDEADFIAELVQAIFTKHRTSKIAILVRQRGGNTNSILDALKDAEIPYFHGLFTDESPEYIRFHKVCIAELIELLKNSQGVSKRISRLHIEAVASRFSGTNDPVALGLISLLEVFWSRIFIDYNLFNNEEKITLIRDTFEHNGLKQYLEFVNSQTIVTTIHGAKGLEWDYVILPDMEQNSFPSYRGLCGICQNKSTCNLDVIDKNESVFLEEISLFYVGVTRAKKQVYFTASQRNANGYASKLSCLLRLPGIIS